MSLSSRTSGSCLEVGKVGEKARVADKAEKGATWAALKPVPFVITHVGPL